MKTLSPQSEQRILSALDRVVDRVDNDGLHPTDAVVKVAAEENFPPHFVTLMCHAYNNGRQEAQRKLSDTILAKTASFPLADAREALRALYPDHDDNQKSAEISPEYDRPPDWVDELIHRKLASADIPSLLNEKPRERQYSATQQAWLRDAEAERAFRKLAALRDRATHARHELGIATTRMHAAIDRLGDYFSRDPSRRIAFSEMQKVAAAYYGRPAVSLLTHVHRVFRIRDKQAEDRYTSRPPVDHTRPPYTLLRECLKLAEEKIRAKRAFDAALAEFEAFVASNRAKLGIETRWKDCDTLLPSRSKQANFLTGVLAGSGLKDLFNVKATTEGLMPEGKPDVSEVFSPQHENELRKIRMQAALAELLTTDEVLKGASPEELEAAYNELADLAPEIASQPGAIRPFLRRRLQGALEPFEVKELLDAEQRARALHANVLQGTQQTIGGGPRASSS